MIIAVMFMLIFAAASIYLAWRLYNVTAEAAHRRGFYDSLVQRYEPLIHGRTAQADVSAEEPAPEPEPVAVDVVGAPETSEDIPAPADVSAEEPAPEPEPEKQTDDTAPEPARNTPKSKKTGRKPAAGRKGRKQ